MEIVARVGRRALAVLVATVLGAGAAACEPASPASPGASAAASPGPSAGGSIGPSAAASAAACANAPLPGTDPPPGDPAWAHRVWYEIFVRSFADGDGDGVGDLAGLTQRLDDLNDGDPATTDDLGITGIWLMPVAAAASYHGYDVTDYRAIEPDYGDAADFEAFIEAAHERGILVIVDFVINHTSRDHPWFREALDGGPKRDWYIWSDADPGWPAVAGPDPWHEAGDAGFYYGAFWEGMPDLDLRNPEVAAEIEAIADFWLDDLGVDGFRIDAAKHLVETDGDHQTNTPESLAFLRELTDAIHAGHPDALVLSEVYDIALHAGSYVPASSDLTFDFGLASAMINALQQERTGLMVTALRERARYWPRNRAASFLSNHDQNRVMSQLDGDAAAAKLAAFMLLTAPGIPFVYYGEEIGMEGVKPDERIRTPMQWTGEAPAAGFSTAQPWQPLAAGWEEVNVADQADDPDSLLATYRRAIALRSSTHALDRGATVVVNGGADPVIGWLRVTADEALLVVVNTSDEPATDYGLSLEEGPLCGVTGAELVAAFPDGGDDALPAPPEVTSDGGLEAYRPYGELAPRAGYVLRLTAR